MESLNEGRVLAGRCGAEQPYHRHRLLRARRRRPDRRRGCRAADKPNELAPLHARSSSSEDHRNGLNERFARVESASKPVCSAQLMSQLGSFATISAYPPNLRFTPDRWGNRPADLWIAEDLGAA